MTLNIIDIAKLAGVSKSTVSRYLNNGYVGAESREKIKKVIDETGFMPQSYAKSLRTGKTNLIGVIVPKISTETAQMCIRDRITEEQSAYIEEINAIIQNQTESIEEVKNVVYEINEISNIIDENVSKYKTRE